MVKALLCGLLMAFALVLGAACGDALSEEEVREKIGRSMVRFAEGGSGFLVEGGYVVTASHVVGLSTALDVVFDDGEEYENVPVASQDSSADLAFLGPIDTSAPPLGIAEDQALREGDIIYTAGYAGEDWSLSVNRGEYGGLSVSDGDVTYVHSTAGGAGGMSGGAIMNGNMEVVGVLIGGDDDRSFGPSAYIVLDGLEKIARGEGLSSLGSRLSSASGEESNEHEFTLRGRRDTAIFWSRRSAAAIEFDAGWDVEYAIFDEFMGAEFKPPFRSTLHDVDERCCFDGTWFVVVRSRFDIDRDVVMRSSVPLARYDDPDDGREVGIARAVTGAFDAPGDIDWYTIQLSSGQGIAVRLGTIFRNELQVTIDYPGAPPRDVVSESLYPHDVHNVQYRAPHDGEYVIAIEHGDKSIHYSGVMEYTLEVYASPTAQTRRSESLASTRESPFGEMVQHRFGQGTPTIRMDYPASVAGGDREVYGTALFEQDRWGRTVTLEERDMREYRRDPDEVVSVEDYMDRSVLASSFPYKGEKVVTARRKVETSSGLPVLIEEFEMEGARTKGVRLAYVHHGETGFMAIFYAPEEVFEEWRPVVDYCIGTFSIGGAAIGR